MQDGNKRFNLYGHSASAFANRVDNWSIFALQKSIKNLSLLVTFLKDTVSNQTVA